VREFRDEKDSGGREKKGRKNQVKKVGELGDFGGEGHSIGEREIQWRWWMREGGDGDGDECWGCRRE